MAKYDAAGDRIRRRVPIALWIMLIGLVIGISGTVWCAMGGLDKFIKTESLSESYDGSDIKTCEIELASGKHKIVRSTDGKIHVTANDVIEGLYTMSCENGKFKFKPKKFSFNAVHLFSGSSNFFGFYKNEAKITIELPDKVFDKLEIENGVGELEVSDLQAEKLDIDNGIGELSISNVISSKTNIDNGIGKTVIKKCDLGNTDIDNGIGNITVEDTKLKDTEIDNGIGETKVTAEIKGDLDVDNGIGDCDIHIVGSAEDYKFSGGGKNVKIIGKIDSGNSKYKIKLDSGIGDIKLDFN